MQKVSVEGSNTCEMCVVMWFDDNSQQLTTFAFNPNMCRFGYPIYCTVRQLRNNTTVRVFLETFLLISICIEAKTSIQSSHFFPYTKAKSLTFKARCLCPIFIPFFKNAITV
jgi:hypothetical protein